MENVQPVEPDDDFPVPDFMSLPLFVHMNFVASLDRGLANGMLDVKQDAIFIHILDTAIKTCGLNQNKLADLFGTSHTTVSRWINGKALPHPQYRRPVVDQLRKEIVAIVQAERDEEEAKKRR